MYAAIRSSVCRAMSLLGLRYTSGMGEQEEWKWRYSVMWGVMYGPLPVGIIVVGIAAILYFATK